MFYGDSNKIPYVLWFRAYRLSGGEEGLVRLLTSRGYSADEHGELGLCISPDFHGEISGLGVRVRRCKFSYVLWWRGLQAFGQPGETGVLSGRARGAQVVYFTGLLLQAFYRQFTDFRKISVNRNHHKK